MSYDVEEISEQLSVARVKELDSPSLKREHSNLHNDWSKFNPSFEEIEIKIRNPTNRNHFHSILIPIQTMIRNMSSSLILQCQLEFSVKKKIASTISLLLAFIGPPNNGLIRKLKTGSDAGYEQN
ncbi:MAG: hypothetical protein V3U73_02415 [bacterium]